MARKPESLLASVALVVVSESLLRRIPAARRENARREALAYSMGILHGCCGPNGDFTGDYRPRCGAEGPMADGMTFGAAVQITEVATKRTFKRG